MILDDAIKRAKVIADFNRRLAARYTQENNIKPDPRKAQEADTYAKRALALDTVIAAAHDSGIDEKNFAPVAHGKWIQSKYVRSLFSCSVCSKSTDVTFNGRNKLYAYCPHCGARMDMVGQEDKK